MADSKVEIIISAKDLASATLNRVSRAANGFHSEMAGLSSKLAGALIGTAAISGVIALGKYALDAAGKVVDMADKIGISTAYLQEMNFAANQAGVSEEALGSALTQLNKRMGEARQGTGELLNVSKQYGVELIDSAGKARSTSAVMASFADKIAGIEDPAERVRVAMAAFGKGGAPMINMLKDGSDGLEKFAEQANIAGLVVEDDLLRASEEAGDALEAMAKVIQAQTIRAVAGLSDEIIGLASTISGRKEEIAGLATTLFEIAKAGIIAAAAIANVVGRAIAGYQQLAQLGAQKLYGADTPGGQTLDQIKAVEKKQAFLDRQKQYMSDISGTPNIPLPAEMGAEYDQNQKRLALLKKTLAGMPNEDFDPSADMKAAREKLEKEIDQWNNMSFDFDQGGKKGGGGGGKGKGKATADKAAKEAEKAMQDRLKFQQDLTDKLNELTMSRFEYEKWALDQQVAEWRTKYGEMGDIAAYEAARTAELNKEAYDEFVANSDTALAGAHRMFTEYANEFGDTSKNIADAVGGMFDTLMTAWYDFTTGADMDFKDLLRSMMAEISKFAMNQFIFGPISKMLSGLTGDSLLNIFSGITGGGGGLGAPTAAGFLGGKAAGGPVYPGGTYLVGERGPELFSTDRPGTITPNHQLGGGAPTINVYQNIRTPDMRGFSESKSQLMAQASVAMRHASRNL